MTIEVVMSKIHFVTVTEANIHYESVSSKY